MRNRRGQAMTEMVIVLPMLIMILGGGIILVYASWQGIKTQQAANVAARMQGQERLAGGKSPGMIELENGTTPGAGDPDLAQAGSDPSAKAPPPGAQPSGSVYGRIYRLIKSQIFPGQENGVYVPPPKIGQNIDKISVYRVINLPGIPFFNWKNGNQMKIEGKAYGGEDTYMYGLPRWGTVSGPKPEWQGMIADKNAISDEQQR